MDWMEDIRKKSARKNRLMFSGKARSWKICPCALRNRAIGRWYCGRWILQKKPSIGWETKYPGEYRPRNALRAAEDWAAGRIKMPIAQREILTCHALARELSIAEDIALCHAVGQACSVRTHPETRLGVSHL